MNLGDTICDTAPSQTLLAKRAYNKVALMRRRGELIAGLCEVCGSPHTDAHHQDYSKPLEVRWLCCRHHRQFHMQFSSGKVLSLDQYIEEAKAKPEEATYIPNEDFVIAMGDGCCLVFNERDHADEYRGKYAPESQISTFFT
jgi:hypothetical protein